MVLLHCPLQFSITCYLRCKFTCGFNLCGALNSKNPKQVCARQQHTHSRLVAALSRGLNRHQLQPRSKFYCTWTTVEQVVAPAAADRGRESCTYMLRKSGNLLSSSSDLDFCVFFPLIIPLYARSYIYHPIFRKSIQNHP